MKIDYQGKMYSDFKNNLGDILVDYLSPIQKEYNLLMKDKGHIRRNIEKMAQKKLNIKHY